MEEQEINNKINTPIQNMVESTQKDGTVGPMVGSIIVILLIFIGGFYFLSSLITTKKTEIQIQQASEEQAEALQVEDTAKQSQSDDVETIEADITSTNIEEIDKSLSDIESEF